MVEAVAVEAPAPVLTAACPGCGGHGDVAVGGLPSDPTALRTCAACNGAREVDVTCEVIGCNAPATEHVAETPLCAICAAQERALLVDVAHDVDEEPSLAELLRLARDLARELWGRTMRVHVGTQDGDSYTALVIDGRTSPVHEPFKDAPTGAGGGGPGVGDVAAVAGLLDGLSELLERRPLVIDAPAPAALEVAS